MVWLAVMCVATSVLSACLQTGSNIGPGSELTSSWIRPEDPQEAIGKREHPAVIAKYGGEYSDVKAERMLAVIVGKLVAASDNPARVYKITLLRGN